MTAPTESPTTHNPAATLAEQEDFGLCGLIVDKREKGNELVCGLPGVDEVLVRNPFGLYVVTLCRLHKEQHRKFYQIMNGRRNRPRRNSNS